MPEGIIVLKWDERSSADILAQYPEDKILKITNKTIMQIYNMHAFSKEGGIANLTIGRVNFSSYYSGSDKGNYFIILFLNLLENPWDYEACLKEVSQIILKNLEGGKYKEKLPSLYKQISEYPDTKKNIQE